MKQPGGRVVPTLLVNILAQEAKPETDDAERIEAEMQHQENEEARIQAAQQ